VPPHACREEGSPDHAVAGLAEDFNRMARALKEAAEREREMEKGRRDLIASPSPTTCARR